MSDLLFHNGFPYTMSVIYQAVGKDLWIEKSWTLVYGICEIWQLRYRSSTLTFKLNIVFEGVEITIFQNLYFQADLPGQSTMLLSFLMDFVLIYHG